MKLNGIFMWNLYFIITTVTCDTECDYVLCDTECDMYFVPQVPVY